MSSSACATTASLSTRGPGVEVHREFLLDALHALEAAGQSPVLRLDGPITPLVIRGVDATWSLLMPARLRERVVGRANRP